MEVAEITNPLLKVEIWEKSEKRLLKSMDEEGKKLVSRDCRALVLQFINSLDAVKIWDKTTSSDIRKELRPYMYDKPKEENASEEEAKQNNEKSEGDVEEEAKVKFKENGKQFSYDYAIVLKLPSQNNLGELKKHLEDNMENFDNDYVEEWEENDIGQQVEEVAKINDYLDYCGVLCIKYMVQIGGGGEEEEIKAEDKKQHLYILFGATEERLRKEAARIEYDLLLDVEQIKIQGKEARFPLYVNLCEEKEDDGAHDALSNLADLFHINQGVQDYKELFKNIYGHFSDFKDPSRPKDEQGRDALYKRYYKKDLYFVNSGCRDNSLFTELARLKLTKSIVEAELNFGGGDLMVAAYARDKKHPCIGFYPLHNENLREELQQKLDECCPVLRDICCCDDSECGKGRLSFVNSDLHWKIRDYFGEQVGFYFHYLSHYTLFLIPAAICGFFISIVQVIAGQPDVPVLPIFGFFMIIWASLYLESWKRMEAELRTIWGTYSFKEKETARPEFEGQLVFSKTTGKLEAVDSLWKSILRLVFSQSVVWTFIASVVAIVIGLLLFKVSIYASHGAGSIMALSIPPLTNALTIMIMNIIFGKFSRKLNHFENHKTDSSFENSLISKTFLFKAVNSYYSLFTIAFFKRVSKELGYCKNSYYVRLRTIENDHSKWLPLFDLVNGTLPPILNDKEASKVYWENDCENWHQVLNLTAPVDDYVCDLFGVIQDKNLTWDYRGDCMFELMIQLASVFITPLIIGNAIEILTPIIKRHQKLKKQSNDEEEDVSVAQHEFSFEQYHGTFADYDELVVQFGFVVLFVVAFPFVPVLALLSCVIEFRIDGIKLTEFTRRPYPKAVYNIGTWGTMLKIIGFVAILTNSALLIMTPSSSFPNVDKNGKEYLNKQTRLIAFIAVEHSLIALKFLLDYFLPDEPRWVGEHLERQEEVTNVLILGETAIEQQRRETTMQNEKRRKTMQQAARDSTKGGSPKGGKPITETTETKETTETTETTETKETSTTTTTETTETSDDTIKLHA